MTEYNKELVAALVIAAREVAHRGPISCHASAFFGLGPVPCGYWDTGGTTGPLTFLLEAPP